MPIDKSPIEHYKVDFITSEFIPKDLTLTPEVTLKEVEEAKPTIYEIIKRVWNSSKIAIEIILIFLKIFGKFKMDNSKTTKYGLNKWIVMAITLAVTLLNKYFPIIPIEGTTEALLSIGATIFAILDYKQAKATQDSKNA